MSRIHLILSIVATIQCAAVTSWGCDLCVVGNPLQPTLADEVGAARDVAVASATGEPDTFEIQSVIKGDAALKGSRANVPGINHAGGILLSRAATDAPWKSLGASGIQLAGFFKVVLGLPAAKPATDAEWDERLAHFRPYLGHPDPRLARSALMEWARAPYHVLKAQQVDGEKLRAWLMNPMQADAQQMMNVVRGAFADADDARPINEPIKAARTASGSTAKTP
jgi:hypothetical protein